MTSPLIQKLGECKDLKRILETTVTEVGQSLHSGCCQILLANPLDPNSAVICEGYAQPDSPRPENQSDWPRLTLPLVLNGRSFGSLILIRNAPWSIEEIDSTSVLIAKLSELIRQAQINDIVQRETFRANFLAEINNLMSYSLGIGDALFMVVNILGKALKASRCLFVCTDDKTAGWKCYEFWQQDKVKSCQEYHWPTNDSSLIAQALRARSPIKFYEGQENSYLTPAQAELQFSGTRSLLALPLLSDNNVYGCVIIQQCDYRRDWTRDEIDMVQHTADKVAQALASLPEEKRIHKPIMQLHQRTIPAEEGGSMVPAGPAPTGAALVQSLKGAFGQKSIPSAADTLNELPSIDMHISLKAPAEPATPESTATPETPATSETSAAPATPATLAASEISAAPVTPATPAAPTAAATDATAATSTAGVAPPAPDQSPTIKPAKRINTGNRLAAAKKKAAFKESEAPFAPSTAAPRIVPVKSKHAKEEKTAQPPSSDIIEPVWGNLDDIPTPSAGSAMSGLGAFMLPRAKSQPAAADSPLRASLHKGVPALEPPPSESLTNTSDSTTDAPPPPAESEEEAKEKVERALAAKEEEDHSTSDYIFAIPNMDPRILGRIVSWVEEIEKKDKYLSPHATTIAEYSCAIAERLNLSPREIADIKIAALLHDVGKLGTAAEILQKRDEDLDDAELLTIMRHPMDGAELLKSIPDLAAFASIVLAHHEEYGGTGYPQGLKGEEIPLAGRIIYIANSYHGMISDKRYGKGMSAKDAQKQLKDGIGTHYDPTLVEVFIEYLQEKPKS